MELLVHLVNSVSDRAQLALIVLPAHLVFLKLPQERLQLVPFKSVSLQGLLQLVVGISELKDFLLVLF